MKKIEKLFSKNIYKFRGKMKKNNFFSSIFFKNTGLNFWLYFFQPKIEKYNLKKISPNFRKNEKNWKIIFKKYIQISGKNEKKFFFQKIISNFEKKWKKQKSKIFFVSNAPPAEGWLTFCFCQKPGSGVQPSAGIELGWKF